MKGKLVHIRDNEYEVWWYCNIEFIPKHLPLHPNSFDKIDKSSGIGYQRVRFIIRRIDGCKYAEVL